MMKTDVTSNNTWNFCAKLETSRSAVDTVTPQKAHYYAFNLFELYITFYYILFFHITKFITCFNNLHTKFKYLVNCPV